MILLSTDRVPADLTAFKAGILDYHGLGRYLAVLNVSDITACGGIPKALLLNLGLPDATLWNDFKALCRGVREIADKFSCPVLGGDLSSSSELSVSATVVGFASAQQVLTRRAAAPGDWIFISRPLGLTCAALRILRDLGGDHSFLSSDDWESLKGQFTRLEPMVEFGKQLASSGMCSSCMDNTDGIGQSLLELAGLSNVRFVIEESRLLIPSIVLQVAARLGDSPLSVVFGPGADFSLVGTLKPDVDLNSFAAAPGTSVQIIGRVEEGSGVFAVRDGVSRALKIEGWNYFLKR